MRQPRFEIRDGEKEERRTISNPVSSIILEIRAPSGGGGRGEDIERAFFFFLTFYSAGKIEGGGGTRVARVSRVDEPRRYEIPSRLLFSAENARAKDFPGKPLICILIEEIITFTGVWPIYKVNRLTPPPFPPLRAMNI